MNIAKILKDCPRGTRLYSLIYGELSLVSVKTGMLYPIFCRIRNGNTVSYTEDGKNYTKDAEPTLFPSKGQRDWSKFNVNTKVNNKDAACQLNQSENVLVGNDIEQNYKRIPFNVELAKKIVNGKVKGRIVTMEGRKVRIICWDKKPVDEEAHEYPIVALIQNNYNGEMSQTFTAEGAACYPNYKSRYDLIIEIPTYYRDYSNFVPQRWQTCLVRDYSLDIWRVAVCSGKDAYGRPLFYSERNADGCCGWYHYLPLSKVTERLIGISKSYEELIKELDAESTATAKNEQQ